MMNRKNAMRISLDEKSVSVKEIKGIKLQGYR